jgi:hypothetical protein
VLGWPNTKTELAKTKWKHNHTIMNANETIKAIGYKFFGIADSDLTPLEKQIKNLTEKCDNNTFTDENDVKRMTTAPFEPYDSEVSQTC